MSNRLFAVAGALLLATAAPANAYWEYGHEAVARIAWLEMKPQTRAEVARLLRQSGSLDTPTCPAATIEQASVWPDCVKPLNERFSYAYSWHYQNVDVCKPFDLKGPCKDGNCVSAQIERNARLLADPKVPDHEKVMALAFLVHFVGDLHQPMHAGDHGDLGGNKVAANYGVIGGRTNLHSIWDGWLAERAATTPPAGPDSLWKTLSPAQKAEMKKGNVEDWSREMWGKAKALAYTTLQGDPCSDVPASRPTLSEAQVQKLIPDVRTDLQEGGIRLAHLLDDALGPEHKAPGQKKRD